MSWLQASPVGHAMREHGVWAYGIVNLVHILGVENQDRTKQRGYLRLLGFWRKVSLRAISGPTVRIGTSDASRTQLRLLRS
jgi:hypothetical protein